MGDQQGQNVMRRKLVIIGDGACGKTSLLSVFTLGYFPTVSPFQSLLDQAAADIFSALRTHCFRELCHRLQSRR